MVGLLSGVELAGTGVSVGAGVLVFVVVGWEVSVGWRAGSVGIAHPHRKSARNTN